MLMYTKYLNQFRKITVGPNPPVNISAHVAAEARKGIENRKLSVPNLGALACFNPALALFMVGVFCKEASHLTTSPTTAKVLVEAYNWGCYQSETSRNTLVGFRSQLFADEADVPFSLSEFADAVLRLAVAAVPGRDRSTHVPRVMELFNLYALVRKDVLVEGGLKRQNPDKLRDGIALEMKQFLLLLLNPPVARGRQDPTGLYA